VYRNTYKDGVVKKDDSLDYSGNFARMLGKTLCAMHNNEALFRLKIHER
jgi:citrate synthase